MSVYRFALLLLTLFCSSVWLILADGNVSGLNLNGNYNNGNNFPIGGYPNGFNVNGANNGNNFVEEETIAECTRCGDSRLIGCMRGKCYYRCYRRCTLGNLTYQEAIRFTLPGY